ncbi:hypothetical protein X772_36315 [Mesorhizobium sp. LSJC280B00]|nr:hypothetical protein X772_36315 [Mesorhizobium sp. LSJC280B00]
MITLSQMAGGDAAMRNGTQLGLVQPADIHRHRTARVEPAARRWIARARRVACEDDAATVGLNARVRRRNCGQQRLAVRMGGFAKQRPCHASFGDAAEIHHSHVRTDFAHDCEVMRDNHDGKAELSLAM